MSPLLFVLYEYVADVLLDEALKPRSRVGAVAHGGGDVGAHRRRGSGANAWNVWSNGEVYSAVEIPTGGDYVIRAMVAGKGQIPFTWPSMSMGIVAEFDVLNEPGDWEAYEVTVPIEAGSRVVAVYERLLRPRRG